MKHDNFLSSQNVLEDEKLLTGRSFQNFSKTNVCWITELERTIQKKNILAKKYVEIFGIPQNIPHVNLDEIALKVSNKINVKLTKIDLLACHRLGNSDRTITKVTQNRKYAKQIMANKNKLKGINLLDVVLDA